MLKLRLKWIKSDLKKEFKNYIISINFLSLFLSFFLSLRVFTPVVSSGLPWSLSNSKSHQLSDLTKAEVKTFSFLYQNLSFHGHFCIFFPRGIASVIHADTFMIKSFLIFPVKSRHLSNFYLFFTSVICWNIKVHLSTSCFCNCNMVWIGRPYSLEVFFNTSFNYRFFPKSLW